MATTPHTEKHQRVLCSAIALAADGALPTEFLIFPVGAFQTSKGRFLFDHQAARDVMSAYQAESLDMCLDLEHQSLDAGASTRADASDARAWFKLELRDTGLFAVNVTWTPDGARRLTEKTQRFISPTFLADKETGRIKRLINAALVAQPATYGAQPLVAASKGAGCTRGPVCDTLLAALTMRLTPRFSKHGS